MTDADFARRESHLAEALQRAAESHDDRPRQMAELMAGVLMALGLIARVLHDWDAQ